MQFKKKICIEIPSDDDLNSLKAKTIRFVIGGIFFFVRLSRSVFQSQIQLIANKLLWKKIQMTPFQNGF